MHRLSLLAIVVAILPAEPALALDQETTARFVAYCEAHKIEELAAQKGHCIDDIAIAYSTLMAANASSVCMPNDGDLARQLLAIVPWLKAHPKLAARPHLASAQAALEALYPCAQ